MDTRQETKPKPKIVLEGNIYIVDTLFISELGYLMMRLYSEEKKCYTTYNLGTHDPDENFLKDAREKR